MVDALQLCIPFEYRIRRHCNGRREVTEHTNSSENAIDVPQVAVNVELAKVPQSTPHIPAPPVRGPHTTTAPGPVPPTNPDSGDGSAHIGDAADAQCLSIQSNDDAFVTAPSDFVQSVPHAPPHLAAASDNTVLSGHDDDSQNVDPHESSSVLPDFTIDDDQLMTLTGLS
jgi:hypothetical protein